MYSFRSFFRKQTETARIYFLPLYVDKDREKYNALFS